MTNGVSQCLAYTCTRKLGNCRSSEGLHSFKPSNGTNLITLLILAGDIEMNPDPRFQCRLCKKYSKASDKVIKCEDCEKRFHASCSKLGDSELLKLKSGNGSWYCTNCKADCGLCSDAVLKNHKAVQCDNCEMWVHNGCSFMTESQYETLQNTTVPGFAQNVYFSTFPILFFYDQLNLENQNRFDLLTKEKKTVSSAFGTSKNKFIGGLKFVGIKINSIRGKNWNCWPSLIFTSLTLWLLRKQKLTAPVQLQNCSQNLALTMYTGKTKTFMVAE